MTTEKHRENKMFAYLLITGLIVVVPISIWYGRKANTEQGSAEPTPAAALPALTDSSFGAVKIGMTLAELQAAIGQLGDTTKLKRECDIVSASDPFKMPAGVSITQVNGRVARIDIENDSVGTDKGIRVGDTEAKVKQMYGANVVVEPHKYIDGHYLEVRFGADSATAKGIVFETDGKKVTTFRAGYWEPVRWVEGCA